MTITVTHTHTKEHFFRYLWVGGYLTQWKFYFESITDFAGQKFFPRSVYHQSREHYGKAEVAWLTLTNKSWNIYKPRPNAPYVTKYLISLIQIDSVMPWIYITLSKIDHKALIKYFGMFYLFDYPRLSFNIFIPFYRKKGFGHLIYYV